MHWRNKRRSKLDIYEYDDVVERIACHLYLDGPSKIRLTSHNGYSSNLTIGFQKRKRTLIRMIISFMFTVSSKIHLKTRYSSFKEHAKFLSTFPSKEALITKGVPMESTLYCWCGTQAENADHILNRGLLARYAWWQIWVWLRTSVPNLVSPREVQEFVKS